MPLKVEAAYLNTSGDNSGAPSVTLATLDSGAIAAQAIITAPTTTPGATGGSYGQGLRAWTGARCS